MDAPPPGEKPCIPGMPCDPSFDDSSWPERTVPHDFVIEGTVDPNLDPNPNTGYFLGYMGRQGSVLNLPGQFHLLRLTPIMTPTPFLTLIGIC